MPTYEYVCDACHHAFDEWQSFAADKLTKCPKCKKKKLQRLMGTGAGLLFKGSGFYITDYRSDAYKSAAKADAGTPAPAKSEGASTGGDKGGKTGSASPKGKTD